MKKKKPESALQDRYFDIFDRCLAPEPVDLERWKSLPSWRLPFKIMMGSDLDDYILEQEMAALSNVAHRYRNMLVFGAVYSTFRDGTRSFAKFEAALARCVRDWRKQPIENYDIWIHLDVKSCPEWFQNIKIRGMSFEIVSVNDFMRSVARESRLNFEQKHNVQFHTTRYYAKTCVKAWNDDGAFELVGEKFELLRSILNLTSAGSRLTRVFGGTKELCNHYPPLVYVSSKNGAGPPMLYAGYGVSKAKSMSLDEEVESVTRSWLLFFAPKPKEGSTRSRLAEAITIAGDGLDSIHPRQQFLSLWTALERITVIDSGSPMEVATRIPRLWPDGPTSVVPKVLQRLATKRNRLVHEGSFDEDDIGLMWLRHIVFISILRIISLEKLLPTSEALAEFYRSRLVAKNILKSRHMGLDAAKAIQDDVI